MGRVSRFFHFVLELWPLEWDEFPENKLHKIFPHFLLELSPLEWDEFQDISTFCIRAVAVRVGRVSIYFHFVLELSPLEWEEFPENKLHKIIISTF